MKYDVFISYSRKDFDEVSALIEMLKRELPGITFWFDVTGIESGDEFEDKIISAIDNSSFVLFALSANSLGSQWTKDEVMYAKNTDKKIIPVLLKGAQLRGWFLFKFGRIDCIDSTDDIQKEKLLNNLSSWLGKNRNTKKMDLPKQSVSPSQSEITFQPEPLCPCGSGKLFKDCHGKTMTPSEKTWEVGDYYDVDGKKGMVFWVDETGKHGKIVSLDEAEVQWCTTSLYHDHSVTNRLVRLGYDHADGYENSDVLKENYNWYSNFPALAWCAQHGTEWYMPSINELITLLSDDVYPSVNRMLFTYGKALQRKNTESRYWSSTVDSDSSIRPWIYRMLDKCKYRKSGFEKHYVRAVCAF